MEQLVDFLHQAKHVLFITGSGISTASGLPTYRGVGGLYQNNFIPPELRMSEAVFNWVPSLTWSHFHKVLKANSDIKPNVAHTQIAKIEKFIPVTVLTQNVDGLHQAAGSTNVIEIHGSARSLMCPACDWKDANPDFNNIPRLPRCPQCGTIVRPPVVLFGGNLPSEALTQVQNMPEPDVVIAIGTTALFQYILEPLHQAVQNGKVTAVIDPDPSTHLIETSHFVIKERAEKALPQLFEQVVRKFNGIKVK